MGVDEPGGAEIARPSGVFAYLVSRHQHHAVSLSYSLTTKELQTKKKEYDYAIAFVILNRPSTTRIFRCVGSSLYTHCTD